MTLSEHLSRRPRRARPVRHLRRPLRRRDPDAADPGARAGLRGGQGRSGLPGRARRLARRLRRPAEPALSRRAPHRAARRRPDLLQARRAQPHRRAQDQQHASARSCSRGAWASGASSPRPAPASTASRPRRSPRACGLQCVVYMGARDIERQKPNVFRMRLLGAEVRAGDLGLGDAQGRDERGAARLGQPTSTTPSTSSARVAGPHPYPAMVRDFQAVIGNEVRAQIMAKEGRLPDTLVACVGGGSNAMGLFHPFLDDPEVRMIGVEAAGHGIETGEHAAALTAGQPGRAARLALLPAAGRRRPGDRAAFDLGRPRLSGRRPGARLAQGPGPGRVRADHATTRRSAAFRLCSELEGILPALEPAHALAHVVKIAPDAAERPSDRHESVRARRQGHLHGGGRDGA